MEVVSDMSGAFIYGVKTHFANSTHTVDWFHVVQLFNKAVDEVRRSEAKEVTMPKSSKWATLKAAEGKLTDKQTDALAALVNMDLRTAEAWRIKELLRWVRRATSLRAAKWRLSWFVKLAQELVGEDKLLAPVKKALNTVEKHRAAIVARWESEYSNARIEALNGIFQAAKVKARG